MATFTAGTSAALDPPLFQQTLFGSSVVGVLPFQQMDNWPSTQDPLYSFSSTHPERSPYAQQQQQQQMDTNSTVNWQQLSPQPSQHGPLYTLDNYDRRYSLIQTYHTPSSTPQQFLFPAYTQLPPSQQSLNKRSTHSNRTSSISTNRHSSNIAQQGSQPRSHSGYSLTSTQGPVLPDFQRSGSQMERMGCMNIQNPPQMGTPVQEQQQQQKRPSDRPFKCNQCPQSFNRNHDLMRHERIHLKLWLFPCGHCKKSYTRKDALKRHTLAKGCGKPRGDEARHRRRTVRTLKPELK